MAWKRYAFHGYLWLQQVDQRALESRLPAAIFYNLLLRAPPMTQTGSAHLSGFRPLRSGPPCCSGPLLS